MTPDTWTYSDLYSALQRRLSIASAYAWIVDVKPIGSTLIYGEGGCTYEAAFTVAADGTVTLAEPKEVRPQTVYWPADEAAFAFSGGTDATGRVTWSGLIFRAGRYPERPIREITEDDIAAIAASVPAAGIPIHLDHNESSFLAPALEQDGARLVKAWQVGAELHGTVEVPGWFASAARDLVKSVSVGLDGTLRSIRELSFVSRPRVADAAVFAASPAFALFAQAHPDLAAIVRPPADVPPAPRKPMLKKPLIDYLKSIFVALPADQRQGATEADFDATFNPPSPGGHIPPPDPNAAVLARLQALESGFSQSTAAQEAERVKAARVSAGLTFYETHLRAGRVTPAERADVLRDYEMAAIADEVHNFAADKPESYVHSLNARYEGRKAGFLFGQNRIPGRVAGDDAATNLGVFSEADFDNAFGKKGDK
ncbi:MAG: hypothetical protein ACO1SV_27620 [Fimbriimonas sp.]